MSPAHGPLPWYPPPYITAEKHCLPSAEEKTAKKGEGKISKTSAKEEAIQAEETQYATEEQVDKLNKYFANNKEARQKTLDSTKLITLCRWKEKPHRL